MDLSRKLAAGMGVVGLVAVACAIYWSDTAVANVLAELAGLLLSVALALLLVEAILRRERRTAYTPLRWVVASTALDTLESIASGFESNVRALDPAKRSSIELRFRSDPSPDDLDADLDAHWWRNRTDDEIRWSLKKMRTTEREWATHLEAGTSYPWPKLDHRRTALQKSLERLERLGDRIGSMNLEDPQDLEFVGWLWRAADKRSELAGVLEFAELGASDQVGPWVKSTLYAVRSAYEAGVDIARPPSQ